MIICLFKFRLWWIMSRHSSPKTFCHYSPSCFASSFTDKGYNWSQWGLNIFYTFFSLQNIHPWKSGTFWMNYHFFPPFLFSSWGEYVSVTSQQKMLFNRRLHLNLDRLAKTGQNLNRQLNIGLNMFIWSWFNKNKQLKWSVMF